MEKQGASQAACFSRSTPSRKDLHTYRIWKILVSGKKRKQRALFEDRIVHSCKPYAPTTLIKVTYPASYNDMRKFYRTAIFGKQEYENVAYINCDDNDQNPMVKEIIHIRSQEKSLSRTEVRGLSRWNICHLLSCWESVRGHCLSQTCKQTSAVW